MSDKITLQQTQGNRKIALGLALFAFALFVGYIARQWLVFS